MARRRGKYKMFREKKKALENIEEVPREFLESLERRLLEINSNIVNLEFVANSFEDEEREIIYDHMDHFHKKMTKILNEIRMELYGHLPESWID